MKNIKPFEFGDIIYCKNDFFKGNQIIFERVRTQGRWEYHSNQGAWLDHNDCELVKKATLKNIKLATKLLDLENEYESFDEEDDYDELQSKKISQEIDKIKKQLGINF